jgi:hypothetical protein
MQEESGTQERRKETEIIHPATPEGEPKPGSVTPGRAARKQDPRKRACAQNIVL